MGPKVNYHISWAGTWTFHLTCSKKQNKPNVDCTGCDCNRCSWCYPNNSCKESFTKGTEPFFLQHLSYSVENSIILMSTFSMLNLGKLLKGISYWSSKGARRVIECAQLVRRLIKCTQLLSRFGIRNETRSKELENEYLRSCCTCILVLTTSSGQVTAAAMAPALAPPTATHQPYRNKQLAAYSNVDRREEFLHPLLSTCQTFVCDTHRPWSRFLQRGHKWPKLEQNPWMRMRIQAAFKSDTDGMARVIHLEAPANTLRSIDCSQGLKGSSVYDFSLDVSSLNL